MARVKAKLTLDPELDALAAWPFPDSSNYFMSGSNHPGEIRGLTDLGFNVGVAVPETADAALTEIEENFGPLTNSLLFVDSGAFSEVAFGPSGPRWPRLISEGEWRKRLGKYLRIAKAVRRRAYLVAPDKVASQEGTLERLEEWGTQIAACAAYGCMILVPVQKGRTPMADFYEEEYEVLRQAGVPGYQLMPAIPLKKDATSRADLCKFMHEGFRCKERVWRSHVTGKSEVESPKIHFLGRGVYSPDYRDTFGVAVAACADVEIFSDSVRIRAIIGSRKSPGALMRAQDALRAMGVTDAFELKRQGLIMALEQERRLQILEAVREGWYDSELFGSSAEHLAWLEAGSPEPDDWEKMWEKRSGTPGHRR